MGSRSRIRWHKVAKLALGVLGCLALFVGLPSLIRRPEPPPLEPDIGLAPLAASRVPARSGLRPGPAPSATPPGHAGRHGGRPPPARSTTPARRPPPGPPRGGTALDRVAGHRRPGSCPGPRHRPSRRPPRLRRRRRPAAPAPPPARAPASSRPPVGVRVRALIGRRKERAMPNAISTGLRTAGALVTASCVALGTGGARDRRELPRRGLPRRASAPGAPKPPSSAPRATISTPHPAAPRGRGLAVTRERGRTPNGSWGAWSVRAPSGTAISRLSVYAAGRRGAGIVPELGIGAVGRAADADRHAPAGASARHLVGPRRPGARGAPSLPPGVGLRPRPGGPGSRQAPRRQALGPPCAPTCGWAARCSPPEAGAAHRRSSRSAQTSGGGVRRLLVQVNGVPVTARTVPCRLAGQIAIRLRPCPARANASFRAATASPPFRQGPNLVRVCAADYAPSTAANRTCAQRRVRIDNLCPISEASRRRHPARPSAPGGVKRRSSPVAFSTAVGAASPAPASAWPPASA